MFHFLISRASYKFLLNILIEFDINFNIGDECDSHTGDLIDKLNFTQTS